MRRKKIQVRETLGDSRNIVFPLICGPGGSKSRLAKAARARGMFGPILEVLTSKKCMPLWYAYFQVKMLKTQGVQTVFGSSDRCTLWWREAHFQVKMYKTHHARDHLEVRMSKKCTP